jgi:hypothetical protein
LRAHRGALLLLALEQRRQSSKKQQMCGLARLAHAEFALRKASPPGLSGLVQFL